MNKSIKLIEKILNTDKNYPYNHPDTKSDIDFSNEAHSVLEKESNDHIKNSTNLNDAYHKDSMIYYSSDGHKYFNDSLRNKTPYNPKYKKHMSTHIKDMKDYTSQVTKHDFKTYRGVDKKITDIKPGTLFKDDGFVSTSLRPQIAKSFSDGKQTNNKGQRFRIHIKPGTKGFYNTINSEDPTEREFILHPGTTFKVGQTRLHKNGKSYTDLHIHSQE